MPAIARVHAPSAGRSRPRGPQPGVPEPTGRSDLLSQKLEPALVATPTRRRPRLLSALTSAVERAPLTLVSGPAGAGKTALAASWREARPDSRDIGWLTLDGFDDDPGTFWSYAVEALARAGADLAAVSAAPCRGSRSPRRSSPTWRPR